MWGTFYSLHCTKHKISCLDSSLTRSGTVNSSQRRIWMWPCIIRNTIYAAGPFCVPAGELDRSTLAPTKGLLSLISRHVRRVSDNGARCDWVPQLSPFPIGQQPVDCLISRYSDAAGPAQVTGSSLGWPRDWMNAKRLLTPIAARRTPASWRATLAASFCIYKEFAFLFV